MSDRYDSLASLRAKKEQLQIEIDRLESILIFKNPKESLRVITKGYKNNRESSLVLSRGFILDKVTEFLKLEIKGGILSKLQKTHYEGDIVQYLAKLAMSYIVTNYIQKKFVKSSWRGKILGTALLYFLPIIIEFIGQKLGEYQRKKTAESISQLI